MTSGSDKSTSFTTNGRLRYIQTTLLQLESDSQELYRKLVNLSDLTAQWLEATRLVETGMKHTNEESALTVEEIDEWAARVRICPDSAEQQKMLAVLAAARLSVCGQAASEARSAALLEAHAACLCDVCAAEVEALSLRDEPIAEPTIEDAIRERDQSNPAEANPNTDWMRDEPIAEKCKHTGGTVDYRDGVIECDQCGAVLHSPYTAPPPSGVSEEKLPDCMMPDGADPCIGYQQLYTQLSTLTGKLEAAEGEIAELDQSGMAQAKQILDLEQERDATDHKHNAELAEVETDRDALLAERDALKALLDKQLY